MKQPGRKRTSSTAVNVISVIIAVNIAGAAVYFLTRHKTQQEQQKAASAGGAEEPLRQGEPSAEVSRALRAAGLAALENGRYDEAVRRFTDAAKSTRASPDLVELIKIATELRDTSVATAAPGSATARLDDAKDAVPEPEPAQEPEKEVEKEEPTPAPAKTDDKLSAAAKRREQQKEREREQKERERQRRLAAANARAASKNEESEAAPAVSPATLIVSSTPSGLVVQLDGRQVDQTPVRLTVEPGPHEIVLLHNNTSVFTRRLTVAASSVQSVDPDLSTQIAMLTQQTAPKAAEPPPAAAQPASASLTTPPAEAPKPTETKAAPPMQQNLDPDALYVVANPALGLSSISSSQLADLYYGRTTTVNGKRAEPILRSPSAGAGAAFFSRILHTNTRGFHESWQKVELSSGTKAPPILANTGDVLRAVKGRSGAISFALGAELNGATTLKAIPISK